MADYGVDLLIDGEWVPVSTLENDGIEVTGGRAKDAGEADPLEARATLIDQTGDLNPRNVRGQYFGKIGQGIPLRMTYPAASTHLWVGDQASGSETPDHASLDVTGDLDVRIDVQAVSWLGDSGTTLAGKYETAGDQRSWFFGVTENGYPWFRRSPDGTFTNAVDTVSSEKLPFDVEGRVTLRLYFVANNGSGQYVVRFYYAFDGVDAPGGWTQLGIGFVGTAGSIYSSTTPVKVGHSALIAGNMPIRVFAMQMRDGIGGAVVANPDFTAATAGATSVVDSTGKTWTVFGDADYRDVEVRATIELQKYPPRWTIAEEFKWANVFGQGISNRLKRPASRLRSPLFREAMSEINLPLMPHYWPFEDGSESSQAANAVDGTRPMLVFGEPQFASSSSIPGSDPLLAMSTGVTATAAIPAYTGTGTVAFRFTVDVPLTGWATPSVRGVLLEFQVSGSAVKWWRLEMRDDGALSIRGYAPDGAELVAGSNITYEMLGESGLVGLTMTQNGTDVDWATFVRYVNDDLSVTELGFNSTFTSRTLGTVVRVTVAPNADLDGGAFGHLMFGTSLSLAAGIDEAIVGNNGERAAVQMLRLADELGVEVRILGVADETSPMSPQPSGTPWELFQRCADTDGGILYEARDRLALEYRTRGALYNGPSIAITYDDPGQSPDMEPEEPGADLVNIYTASRPGGSEYTATQEDGPLSVQAFPAGAGPLDGGADYSTEGDSDLHDAAWWGLHLSTWDEYRYPVVKFNIEKLRRANPQLARAVRNALPGDRFVISNPPADLPPWPVDLMVQGFAEEQRTSVFDLSFNCTPGRPWQVGVAGVDPVESDGTTLTADITAGDTTFQWDVVGEPWAEDSSYPLMMVFLRDGREMERFEVTDIVGTGSTQDVTATRGTDGGWATDHPAGTVIKLWQPIRAAR